VIPTPLGTVIIEPGAVEDAGAVGALQRAILEEERWFIMESDEFDGSEERLGGFLRRLVESTNSLFLVARHQGVVGVLYVRGEGLRRLQHVGRLELYVAKAYRGKGVGNGLIEAAVRWASHSDILEKLSLVVFSDNEAAIALYQKHGFVEEGRRTGEYLFGDGSYRDDVLMARRV